MECVILRTEPSGENDLLISALTRDGMRHEAVLRSGRKMTSRVRAGVLPFSLSDCTFAPGRHTWVVRNAVSMFSFSEFRTSLAGLAVASACAACIDYGVREEQNPTLFSGIGKIFRDLHTALAAREPKSLFVRRACGAWIQTLTLVGLRPLFDRCARCGSPKNLAALSSISGGIVCGPCVRELPDSRALSSGSVKALAQHLIPSIRGDSRQLVLFLGAFTAWQLPESALRVQWGAKILS